MPQKYECLTCGFSHIFEYAETPALLKTCPCGAGEMTAAAMPEPLPPMATAGPVRFTPHEIIELIDAHAQASCASCNKLDNCLGCLKDGLIADLMPPPEPKGK